MGNGNRSHQLGQCMSLTEDKHLGHIQPHLVHNDDLKSHRDRHTNIRLRCRCMQRHSGKHQQSKDQIHVHNRRRCSRYRKCSWGLIRNRDKDLDSCKDRQCNDLEPFRNVYRLCLMDRRRRSHRANWCSWRYSNTAENRRNWCPFHNAVQSILNFQFFKVKNEVRYINSNLKWK